MKHPLRLDCSSGAWERAEGCGGGTGRLCTWAACRTGPGRRQRATQGVWGSMWISSWKATDQDRQSWKATDQDRQSWKDRPAVQSCLQRQ